MSLKIITGCMFSGKTTEIFKILSTLVSKNVLLINSNLDSRYDKNKIVSHDNQKIDCLSLSKLSDIPIDLYTKCEYIIIDEAQFFDDLYDFVTSSVDLNNKHIIVVGLNGDFNRKNFGDIYKLYPFADDITLLKGKCQLCENKSIFSKKMTNDASLIDIGSSDKYISVCRICYNK